MKPKQLIKDVTFDFDKDETKCGPHIAYTLPSQGGAASGLNVGYLFKSDEVSEQTVKEAEEIQKAMSMKNQSMHALVLLFMTITGILGRPEVEKV